VRLNGLSGFCVTKLDVLDGMEEVKVCTAYRLDGETVHTPPTNPDDWERLEPVYESFPGWSQSSRGARSLEELPANARAYLQAMEQISGAPIHMVSTGPDRSENIIIRHPLD
jgi:adenylosuccinate synthase